MEDSKVPSRADASFGDSSNAFQVDIERRRNVLRLLSAGLGALALGGQNAIGAGFLRLPTAGAEALCGLAAETTTCTTTLTQLTSTTSSSTTSNPATSTQSRTADCPATSWTYTTMGLPSTSWTTTQTLDLVTQTVTQTQTIWITYEPPYTETISNFCRQGTLFQTISESYTSTLTATWTISQSSTYTQLCGTSFDPDRHDPLEALQVLPTEFGTVDQDLTVLWPFGRRRRQELFVPTF